MILEVNSISLIQSKTFILTFAFLSIYCSLHAQKVFYEFPKPVVEKLQSYTESVSIGKGNIFVLELYTNYDNHYVINVLEEKRDTSDIVYNVLVKTSTRFAKIGKLEIPIVTSEDFTFADFGTVYDPNNKNPKRRVGKRKIVRSFDGW